MGARSEADRFKLLRALKFRSASDRYDKNDSSVPISIFEFHIVYIEDAFDDIESEAKTVSGGVKRGEILLERSFEGVAPVADDDTGSTYQKIDVVIGGVFDAVVDEIF